MALPPPQCPGSFAHVNRSAWAGGRRGEDARRPRGALWPRVRGNAPSLKHLLFSRFWSPVPARPEVWGRCRHLLSILSHCTSLWFFHTHLLVTNAPVRRARSSDCGKVPPAGSQTGQGCVGSRGSPPTALLSSALVAPSSETLTPSPPSPGPVAGMAQVQMPRGSPHGPGRGLPPSS